MKPSDVKRVVDRLEKLGFKVAVKPGPVDRANCPMSMEIQGSREFTIEERRAFAEFLGFERIK
jgi:hypothetical protein